MPKVKYTWLAWLIKLSILILLFWALFHYIFQKNDVNDFWISFKQALQNSNGWLLTISFLLMFVNWNLEAFKWKFLIRKVEPISQLTAFISICSGITFSMFTPNRIGEFGGKILFLKNVNKTKGIAISLMGSVSQWIASVGIGVIGIAMFLWKFENWSAEILLTLILCSTLVLAIITFLFFQSSRLNSLITSKYWGKNLKKFTATLKQLNHKDLFIAIVISFLRHLVFSVQYILLFYFFGIQHNFSDVLILVLSIFLVQTIVPSIALVELGIRTSIALFFMEYINANPISVISAALALWIINLMTPALVGVVAILKLNLTKQLMNESD